MFRIITILCLIPAIALSHLTILAIQQAAPLTDWATLSSIPRGDEIIVKIKNSNDRG